MSVQSGPCRGILKFRRGITKLFHQILFVAIIFTSINNIECAYVQIPPAGNVAQQNAMFMHMMATMCKQAMASGTTDPSMLMMCSAVQHSMVNPDPRSAASPQLTHSSNPELGNCSRLPPRSAVTKQKSDDLQTLLDYGSELLEQYPPVEEAILILGNTGSGKTTITQFLAGDLRTLHGILTQSDRLVIVDDENRIGAPTTVSKTLVPELVISADTTAFYDCPGFDDTRGLEQDIATNFFMNQVVRKVSRVKMLFLVVHSSVKLGNERLDFDLLTKHASKFVKNLRKYKNSIGLVVTKVSSYSGQGNYVKDEAIMNEIVEFLTEFNETLHSRLESEKDVSLKREILGKIEFLKILLQQDENGGYSRISFSRDPEKCGPLSDSTVVSQSKERIENLFRNLEYIPVIPENDFGYTLKDKTSLSIHKLTESNNAAISKSVEILVADLQNWYERRNMATSEVGSILEKLQTDYQIVESLAANFGNIGNESMNPFEFNDLLTSSLELLGYAIPHKFESLMERQQAYFDFFDEVVGSRQSRKVKDWSSSIQSLKVSFSNQRDWYNFCTDLKAEVDSFRFQVDKPRVTETGQFDWLTYIERGKLFPVSQRVFSVSTQVEPRHYNVLGSVMEYALEPTRLLCNGTTLKVIGNFVVFSKLTNSAGSLKSHCPSEIKKLEVFASHTVFIDSDLKEIGKELNLVVVSPNWQIIGQRLIDLSGANSTRVDPPSGEDGFIPKYRQSGGNGANGIPGKPGGAGGSFFGISLEIHNSADLQIISNGGNGGDGQHGGNGGRGAEGDFPFDSDTEQEKYFTALVYTISWRKHDGYNGFPGGNGGDGGVGGLGGMPGRMSLVSLSPSSHRNGVRIVAKSGRSGAPGDGGLPGQGGSAGYSMKCANEYVLVFRFRSTCSRLNSDLPKADNGKPGRPNQSSIGLQAATAPQYSINEWESLLNFKYYFFHTNEEETIRLKQFIDESPSTQKYFTLKSFAVELSLLEQYISLEDEPNKEILSSSYKSLISRMESYFERNQHELTNDEMKVIAVMLASAYSKILSFGQTHDLGMVIDVAHFFTIVKQQVSHLHTLRASAAVEEIRANFNKEIVRKEGEVKRFMAEVVTPALHDAERELQHRLTSLGKEFEGLVLGTEKDLEVSKSRVRRGSELDETLKLKQVYELVQTGIRIVSFLDASGTFPFLTEGMSLLKNLRGGSEGSSELQGADGLESESGGSGGTTGDEVVVTIRQVSNLLREATKLYRLFATEANSAQNHNQRNGENESESEEESQGNNESINEKTLTYLGEEVARGLYSKFQNDQGKMAQLERLVKEAELAVKDVYQRKQVMEKKFVPVVQSMMTYFSNIKSHLERNSSSETLPASQLDITKWQISKGLEEIKESLQVVAKGISTQNDFMRCLDRLQDAFTMMIDLYNNIEEYQNSKNLANYVAAVSSASLNSARISDNDLGMLASNLEKVIGENLLKREYHRAMHAFKQWVFPFAKLHLEQFQKAGGSNVTIRETDLSSIYVSKIDKLQQQLERYKATTFSSQDTHIIKTNFSSSHRSSKPFFVWSNEKFGSEIEELLSGKLVHLKAEVNEAMRDRDAVKFAQIEINIKLSEGKSTPALENELREELENFLVSMTHSGISTYKFHGEFFVMTGENQTIRYNFERDSNGDRLGRNQIYEKFARGDFLLSPYSLWSIQLSKAFPSGRITFGKLQRFASVVDVELVGTGVYVDANVKLNVDLELDKYYVRDESLRETIEL